MTHLLAIHAVVRSYCITLMVVGVWLSTDGALADIVILQRESRSGLFVFAGSGPGVDQYGNSDVTNDLTGTFSFSDNYTAAVDNQTGAATAFGEVTTTDGVAQSSAESLFLSVGSAASGTAEWLAGTGLTASDQTQLLRVRFRLEQPVRYSLQGFFDPGQQNGNARVRFYNTAFGFNQFNIEEAGILEITGLIEPGSTFNTYEFIARISNNLTTNGAKDPIDFDASNMNLQFTISEILLGDINLDGVVNLLDVDSFIKLLSSSTYQFEADCNSDGLGGRGSLQPTAPTDPYVRTLPHTVPQVMDSLRVS